MCGHLTDNDQQDSYKGQESDVERAAQSHAGDDEGDDEDEEADDHQSSHRLGPSWSPTHTNAQIRWKYSEQSEHFFVFELHTFVVLPHDYPVRIYLISASWCCSLNIIINVTAAPSVQNGGGFHL